MKIRPFSGLLSLIMVAAIPAGAATVEERLLVIENQLDSFDRFLGRIEQRLGQSQDSQVLTELLQRMDTLEQEVRQLRGEAESNQYEITQMKERLRDLYLDMDRRLLPVEAGARQTQTAPAAPTPEPTIPAQPPVVGTQSGSAPAGIPAIPPVTALAPASPAAASPASASSAPTTAETNDYQRAFTLLQEGRNADAAAAFALFLNTYPGSSYAANAQYWLGEAYYVSKDFSKALVEFRKVPERFAQSTKVQDALLKIGFTHYELGEYAEARRVLNDVRARYPGSTVARLAEQRLQRMGEAGL